jgi:hypothetical protein
VSVCLSAYLPTSMEHSHSWAANRSSASQEIHLTLQHPKIHYLTHNSPPPPDPILSQINPVHAPTHFLKILLLSSHLLLGLPSGLIPSGFPTKHVHLTKLRCIDINASTQERKAWCEDVSRYSCSWSDCWRHGQHGFLSEAQPKSILCTLWGISVREVVRYLLSLPCNARDLLREFVTQWLGQDTNLTCNFW